MEEWGEVSKVAHARSEVLEGLSDPNDSQTAEQKSTMNRVLYGRREYKQGTG